MLIRKAHTLPARLASVPPTQSCAKPVVAHGAVEIIPCLVGLML